MLVAKEVIRRSNGQRRRKVGQGLDGMVEAGELVALCNLQVLMLWFVDIKLLGQIDRDESR